MSRLVEITKVGNNYTVNPNATVPAIETNKTATINVSEYTAPVEITPTSPNTAMAKATVTLSNIPSGGVNALSSKVPVLSNGTDYIIGVYKDGTFVTDKNEYLANDIMDRLAGVKVYIHDEEGPLCWWHNGYSDSYNGDSPWGTSCDLETFSLDGTRLSINSGASTQETYFFTNFIFT